MDDRELLRYARHIVLPGIDIEGQEKLLRSRVLVLGLGGLGSAAAQYLAASGVGELVLADPDRVELSNLARQVLHCETRLGWLKTDSAAAALTQINPATRCTRIPAHLDADSLPAALEGCDLALDCSDNFATRHALNVACFRAGVPLVSAAALGWEGQLAVFDPRLGGPCYRCVYPGDAPPEDRACAVNGIASPVVGTMGVLQALESLKLLVGAGTSASGRLLVFDALAGEFHHLRVARRPDCPVCGR